jgi:hypothetical protein
MAVFWEGREDEVKRTKERNRDSKNTTCLYRFLASVIRSSVL